MTGSGTGPSRARLRSPAGGGALQRLAPSSPFAASIVLAGVAALLLLAYLAIGNLLVLLVAVAVVVFGVDRLLRMHPQGRFHGPAATVLYLFVPALYMLGSGLALDAWDAGLWRLPFVLLAGLGLGVTANAEYLTVDTNTEAYEAGRTLLLGAIYITAFLLFAGIIAADMPLPLSMALVGVATFLLTVDILRELEPDTAALFTLAASAAVVIAECRLVMYYISLSNPLPGALLGVVFYIMTSLIQNQVSGRLDRKTLRDYGVVLVVCVVILIVGRAFSG